MLREAAFAPPVRLGQCGTLSLDHPVVISGSQIAMVKVIHDAVDQASDFFGVSKMAILCVACRTLDIVDSLPFVVFRRPDSETCVVETVVEAVAKHVVVVLIGTLFKGRAQA